MELIKRQYFDNEIVFNPASIMQGERDLSTTHNIIMGVDETLQEKISKLKPYQQEVLKELRNEWLEQKEQAREERGPETDKEPPSHKCGACGAVFTGLFKDHVCKDKDRGLKEKNNIAIKVNKALFHQLMHKIATYTNIIWKAGDLPVTILWNNICHDQQCIYILFDKRDKKLQYSTTVLSDMTIVENEIEFLNKIKDFS